MVSRLIDLERKTLLVQFIGVQPLTFYSTADGTDLVQDILRNQLNRSDAEIFGQEGSLAVDDQGEFLLFEPTDLNNRTLHLPIEHLAYCGALRRLRHDTNDQRNPDQIHRRDFENVDLANRYAHLIIGPPIFSAVFHGFDNALCYTFVTQTSEDACLLVMKLMRAFKMHEQKLDRQGQTNQGFSSLHDARAVSPLRLTQGASPLQQTGYNPSSNFYHQDPRQDELIQRILSNPNLELVSSPTPFISQQVNDIPILSATSSMNQSSSPFNANNQLSHSRSAPFMGRSSSPMSGRPPSPPILGISNGNNHSSSLLNDKSPQVIYKPNNQEIVYKQNIMVRWLQPPTPPPPAPIIIREVQAPSAPPPPPIVCRQVPRCPPTPPPIIVRERPPPCPPTGQPLIIEKRIPAPILPRQVIVERYPAPPPKQPAIIYEKYLPTPRQPRQVIVRREICQPNGYSIVQQQQPAQGPRLIREIVRQIPQTSGTAQQALVCMPQQQQQQATTQPAGFQQLVPVYATRQHLVQPQGVRVIRQVIGPSTQLGASGGQAVYAANGTQLMQAMPQTMMQ